MTDMIDVILLRSIELLQSSDDLKRDLEVTCRECGHVLCDAEHGDSLETFANMARDHICLT